MDAKDSFLLALFNSKADRVVQVTSKLLSDASNIVECNCIATKLLIVPYMLMACYRESIAIMHGMCSEHLEGT